eukprot:scaffold30697_cov28-Tisochrysis_lutea.AAC.8
MPVVASTSHSARTDGERLECHRPDGRRRTGPVLPHPGQAGERGGLIFAIHRGRKRETRANLLVFSEYEYYLLPMCYVLHVPPAPAPQGEGAADYNLPCSHAINCQLSPTPACARMPPAHLLTPPHTLGGYGVCGRECPLPCPCPRCEKQRVRA